MTLELRTIRNRYPSNLFSVVVARCCCVVVVVVIVVRWNFAGRWTKAPSKAVITLEIEALSTSMISWSTIACSVGLACVLPFILMFIVFACASSEFDLTSCCAIANAKHRLYFLKPSSESTTPSGPLKIVQRPFLPLLALLQPFAAATHWSIKAEVVPRYSYGGCLFWGCVNGLLTLWFSSLASRAWVRYDMLEQSSSSKPDAATRGDAPQSLIL
ncbi:hypothetical protein Tco_0209930 [Tanacetum coccineum]